MWTDFATRQKLKQKCNILQVKRDLYPSEDTIVKMWRFYLLLSLQVMMIKSLPMYLPEMLPQVRSPLPLLQEELLRLQAMQLQHIPDMQQFQAVPGMQQFQHLQDLQQLQAIPDMQQLQVIPAIQQPQAMPVMPINQMNPILVLLPGIQKASDSNNIHQIATKRIKDKKVHKETVDEDLESVTIEAEEPIPTIDDQKAILLVPNPRFSINSIISAIPFLPFEINVPDTIAWMYNGIISIIGQIQNSQSNRLKFKQFNNFGNIQDQQLRPIIVITL